MTRFRSVAIDVDSTLCGLEGIDWLARRKGTEVATKVAELTSRAMDGSIALDEVYGERLKLVAPTREEVSALGAAYSQSVASGGFETIRTMQAAGVDVHLISGGLIDAVSHVAERIPLDAAKVHAVEIYFNEDGSYLGFDTASPLTRQSGKRELLKELRMLPPVLMVGDGMTDVETRPAVDAFAAFTGFVRREQTVAAADHVVSNFHELLELVMK